MEQPLAPNGLAQCIDHSGIHPGRPDCGTSTVKEDETGLG